MSKTQFSHILSLDLTYVLKVVGGLFDKLKKIDFKMVIKML